MYEVWEGQLLGQSACQQGGEDAAEEAAEGEAGAGGGVAEPRVAVVGGDADLAPRPLLTHVHRVLVAGVGGAALVHLPGDLVDGLVAGVDGHVVVLGALDVGPLVLVADTLQQVVGVRDASHALDTEAHLSEAAQQQEDGEEEGVGGSHDEDMQSPPSRDYLRLVQQSCRLSSSSAPDNS